MTTIGIRILDEDNGVISVKLQDILEEINNGKLFSWAILFFDAIGHLGNGRSIVKFSEEIDHSEKGILIDWNEIWSLANKLHQIIDAVIVGCKNPQMIKRHEKDQDMYETCDFVIVMFDSSYWEVFSFDFEFIERLANKFKKIERLESNF